MQQQKTICKSMYCISEITDPVKALTTTTVSDSSQQQPPPQPHQTSIQRALSWLVTQREPNWSWRNDTPKVVTALQLAGHEINDLVDNQLEMQLSSKQMEIEIVVLLWRLNTPKVEFSLTVMIQIVSRHHEIPITPPKLAQYCLALSALCFDPRQFHGHDLIGTLQHHEPIQDLEFAYSSMAACSARAHVRKKQIRRLLDIANTAKDHNIGNTLFS